MTWDPNQYAKYTDERSRPFVELVNRIGAIQPRSVVDLGCGSGELTATLGQRWPNAHVVGVDNDDAMLAAAQSFTTDRVSFSKGDIASWVPPSTVDVIVSNAALQWVPGHLGQLPQLVEHLNPGGWLAVQVPGNLDDPHHQAIRQVRAMPQWKERIGDLAERTHSSYPAEVYLSLLSDLGMDLTVDAWETTYVHILQGENPVLEWVKGTGLRPVLSRLTPNQQTEFCDDLAPLLRAAYGSRPWGTPFPFRRVFVVAHKD